MNWLPCNFFFAFIFISFEWTCGMWWRWSVSISLSRVMSPVCLSVFPWQCAVSSELSFTHRHACISSIHIDACSLFFFSLLHERACTHRKVITRALRRELMCDQRWKLSHLLDDWDSLMAESRICFTTLFFFFLFLYFVSCLRRPVEARAGLWAAVAGEGRAGGGGAGTQERSGRGEAPGAQRETPTALGWMADLLLHGHKPPHPRGWPGTAGLRRGPQERGKMCLSKQRSARDGLTVRPTIALGNLGSQFTRSLRPDV